MSDYEPVKRLDAVIAELQALRTALLLEVVQERYGPADAIAEAREDLERANLPLPRGISGYAPGRRPNRRQR